MWHGGSVEIGPARVFKAIAPLAQTWAGWQELDAAQTGATVRLDPLRFIYAAMRTAVTGSRYSRGAMLSSLHLAQGALAFLTPHPLSGGGNGIELCESLFEAKDFVGTAYKGVIGAALAYWELQARGFAWLGHWEDLATTATGPQPDFVFGSAAGLCAMDAKGSAQDEAGAVQYIKRKWREQLEPQLGPTAALPGIQYGCVMGAWLPPNHRARFISAWGWLTQATVPPNSATPVAAAPAGQDPVDSAVPPLRLAQVQRQSYADAALMIGLFDEWGLLRHRGPNNDALLRQWATRWLDGAPDDLITSDAFEVFVPADGVWQITPFIRRGALQAALLQAAAGSTQAVEARSAATTAEESTVGADVRLISSLDGVGIKCVKIAAGPDGRARG